MDREPIRKSERQNAWREGEVIGLHQWKRSNNTISRKEQRHIRNSQKITKRMSQICIISCCHFARCRAPFCCVVDERLGTSCPLPNSPAPKLSLALSLRQRVQNGAARNSISKVYFPQVQLTCKVQRIVKMYWKTGPPTEAVRMPNNQGTPRSGQRIKQALAARLAKKYYTRFV